MKRLLSSLALLAFLSSVRAFASDTDLPGSAFDSDRYAPLWENSPFSVATPVAVESQEYFLVGVAQFDGVSYASIVDKQSQNHFVVTSTTPVHGLKLVSLTRGQEPNSTFATIQKDGALLKLKLETGSSGVGGGPPMVVPNANPSPIILTTPHSPPMFGPRFRRFPPHPQIYVPQIYVPHPTASPQ